MFDFEFLSMKQLGKMFGVTSHKIGKWLIEIGLRDRNRQPTQRAVNGGYCREHTDEDGIRFVVWHREKVTKLLVDAGHQLANQPAQAIPQPVKRKPPSDPYKLITDKNGGHQIVNQEGVDILTRDPKWLSRLVAMIDQASKKGYL